LIDQFVTFGAICLVAFPIYLPSSGLYMASALIMSLVEIGQFGKSTMFKLLLLHTTSLDPTLDCYDARLLISFIFFRVKTV